MRFVVTVASLACLTTGVLACTVETKTTGPAPSDDAGVTRSDDGRGKSTSTGKTAKDAGSTSKPQAGDDGPKTCRTAAECLGDCGEDDEACMDACLASLPDAEMAELGDLATCIQNSGCEDQACVEETCAAEFAACAE